MTVRRAALTLVVLGATLFLFGTVGCHPAAPHSANGQSAGGADAEPDPDQNLTGEVTGTNWHIPWMILDAKGRKQPALVADAGQGKMTNLDDNYTMQLHGVRAKVFQDGVHAADIVASQVDANSTDHLIVGTGGVRVTSLTNPPDTVVTADKITWDPRAYVMVAVGHAVVTKRPHDGSVPITQTGGRITFDTKFQKIKVEAL
jgi:hypothetical protein